MKTLLLLAVFLGGAAGLEDPTAKVAEIRKEAQAKESAYLRDWLSRARLDPIAVPAPENPADPRASEVKAESEAKGINNTLADLKNTLATIPDGVPLAMIGFIPGQPEAGRTIGPQHFAAVLAAQTRNAEPAPKTPARKPPSGSIKSRPGE